VKGDVRTGMMQGPSRGAGRRKAERRRAQRVQDSNGANAERRQMPYVARCQTTRNAHGRANDGDQLRRLPSVVGALSGISRTSAFRAVRHLAMFGISRWYYSAPFGLCALWALRRSATVGPNLYWLLGVPGRLREIGWDSPPPIPSQC
jgi:hypothetical protein